MPGGANSLIGGPLDAYSYGTPAAAPDRTGRGIGGALGLGGRDVVTDGTEWVVAIIVVGALALLIALRAGGIQPILAVR